METLTLQGELNIYQAGSLRAQLEQALDDGVDSVDLSAVTEFDTSAAQILIWARREAAERGRTLRLTGASATVSEYLELMGMQTLLPCEPGAPA